MSKMAKSTEESIARFQSLNPVIAGITATRSLQSFGLDMIQASSNADVYSEFAASKMQLERTTFGIRTAWDRVRAVGGKIGTDILNFAATPVADAIGTLSDKGAQAAYRAARLMTQNAERSGDPTEMRQAEAQMKIAAEMGSMNARAALRDATASVENMNRLFLQDFDILSGGASNWAVNMIDSRMAGPKTAPNLPDVFGGGPSPLMGG